MKLNVLKFTENDGFQKISRKWAFYERHPISQKVSLWIRLVSLHMVQVPRQHITTVNHCINFVTCCQANLVLILQLLHNYF